MVRDTIEFVEFTGEEKGKYDFVRGMLSNFIDDLKKELAYPSCSDLLIDTEELLEHMDRYAWKYYESRLNQSYIKSCKR
jgi:hypothetical protein